MTERPASFASATFGTALNTPLPNNDTSLSLNSPQTHYISETSPLSADSPHGEYPLLPPIAPFHVLQPKNSNVTEASGSNRDSYTNSVIVGQNLTPLIPAEAKAESSGSTPFQETAATSQRKRRSVWVWIIGAAGLAAVVAAVIIPVYFLVIKPKNNTQAGFSSASSSHNGSDGDESGTVPGSSSGGGASQPQGAITGGDGSTVTMDDGTTFTYTNNFGGFWVSDPSDPFNNNARPNSWTPPLNQTWDYNKDQIMGVNLGGWLVLEPFITPALFQRFPGAVDEWTLSTLMAADTANGGLKQLEDHYETFVTEKDFADIAAAGLNWIRLPVPYWAVDQWPGEPFLERTSWKYALRAFRWARKYGLRINLDLHTAPGSQNSYNHSGKLLKWGQPNFLKGAMGYANAQRILYYIRVFTEFISQPEYLNLIPIFGILNEPPVMMLSKDVLTSFYLEAHTMIRQITGYGEGNGPFISIHDGFREPNEWANFLPGSDRIALDTHPYIAFDGFGRDAPINTGSGLTAGGDWPKEACDRWAASAGQSRIDFGVTVAGEYSNGFNDCGFYLRGIPSSHDFKGDCAQWEDSTNWDDATKAGLKMYALASMDALKHYFFWNYKISPNADGIIGSPLWSYKLGLENGWMPLDPREANGICDKLGSRPDPFAGRTFLPWQTGGVGAGTIAAASTEAFPWPPRSFTNIPNVATLPVYTATGVVNTLPPPTFTGAPKVKQGNGWANPADTALAPAPIATCTYPDAWDSSNVDTPASCS